MTRQGSTDRDRPPPIGFYRPDDLRTCSDVDLGAGPITRVRRRPAVSGYRSAVSGQRSAVSGQRQQSAVSGQRSEVTSSQTE